MAECEVEINNDEDLARIVRETEYDNDDDYVINDSDDDDDDDVVNDF